MLRLGAGLRLKNGSTATIRLEVQQLEDRIVPCIDPLSGLPDADGHANMAVPALLGQSSTVSAQSGGTGSASGPISGQLPVPAYNSRPGSNNVIFLDFDGDYVPTWYSYSPGTIPAYDIDADPTTFSAQELSNIHALWEIVAEGYAPFDVNVTTVDPRTVSGFAGHVSQVDIGGNGSWQAGIGA